MTDQPPSAQPAPLADTPGQRLPSVAAGVADRLAHVAAGALATLLISHGLITKDQSSQTVEIVASVMVGLAGIAFSWLRAQLDRQRVAAALNTPAPQPPVKP